MYSKEQIDLCRYRLSKAQEYRKDAETSLGLNMYDTAANRSYYAIFHAVRALLALSGKDFRKHSGVISCFQMDYIKTGIFDKELSDIVKSAFSLMLEPNKKLEKLFIARSASGSYDTAQRANARCEHA